MPNDDDRPRVPRDDSRVLGNLGLPADDKFGGAPEPRKDPRRQDVFTSINDEPKAERSVAERVKAGEKVSVNDLAVHLGHVKTERREERLEPSDANTKTVTSWQHAAAAALHGWAQYEFDEGEPFELTREEYEGALKAASEPNEAGIYVAHDAAYVGSHDLESDAERMKFFEEAAKAHKDGAEAARRARDERRGQRTNARGARR